jgi:hypothetical protein
VTHQADSFFLGGGTDGVERVLDVYNLLIAYSTFYRFVPAENVSI